MVSEHEPITDWRVMGDAEARSRKAILADRMVRAGMDGRSAEELAHRWYSSDTIFNHVLSYCDRRIERRKRR